MLHVNCHVCCVRLFESDSKKKVSTLLIPLDGIKIQFVSSISSHSLLRNEKKCIVLVSSEKNNSHVSFQILKKGPEEGDSERTRK